MENTSSLGFFFISFLEPKRRFGSCFHILLKLEANDSNPAQPRSNWMITFITTLFGQEIWAYVTQEEWKKNKSCETCPGGTDEGWPLTWSLNLDVCCSARICSEWKQNSTELRDSSKTDGFSPKDHRVQNPIGSGEKRIWSWTSF